MKKLISITYSDIMNGDQLMIRWLFSPSIPTHEETGSNVSFEMPRPQDSSEFLAIGSD